MKPLASRLRFVRWVPRSCLLLQLVCLTALTSLNFLDERLEHVSLWSLLVGRMERAEVGYSFILAVLAYGLLFSIGLLGVDTLFGKRTHRSLKNMLVLTAVIAATLSLFTSWQRISWEGRRQRMNVHLSSLQTVCDALQTEWPLNDMNHDLLGAIMTYPQWNPSTLILLTPKPVGEAFRIAAIDRSKNGVLRFELSSGSDRIWLEHRIDPRLETDFTNGIQQSFVLQYYVPLSSGWYMARYQ